MKWLRRILTTKVDLWEVLLVAGFVVVLVQRPDDRVVSDLEIEHFRERYGPSHYTEHEEEWMIRDFFQGKRGGFFVDVGANHYKQYNKTYYLESELGWSGLAIEPLVEFAADYGTHRPRTRFFPFFVSERSDEQAKLFVISGNTTVSSSDEAFVRLFGTPDEVKTVPTIALTDLLDREGIERIDFLSMDIELHEPEALRGFDIGRFRPSLVCIEALLPVRQAILDYFAANDYVIDGRYLRADRENLYFVPRQAAGPVP